MYLLPLLRSECLIANRSARSVRSYMTHDSQVHLLPGKLDLGFEGFGASFAMTIVA